MKIDFSGKVALVTGATRGIGKRIADDLDALGAELILTGTHKNEIDDLNASQKSQKGSNKQYFQADFTDTKSTEEFLNELDQIKKIDICINNAGINKIDFIQETSVKDWNNITDVNLKAPFLITRCVAEKMKKNGYGRIVNIASIFSVTSKQKRSIYSTTKFALIGLTKAVSNELAGHNVLVNAVSPGFVITDMTKKNLSKNEMETLASEIPAGRFAQPEEISRVVLFLISEWNSYLTGKNIVVDGGFIDV